MKLRMTIATLTAGWLVAAGASVSAQATGNFDESRLLFQDSTVYFPFVVEETQALLAALRDGDVKDETRLLVMDHPAGRLAFIMDQMSYHHVAQGEIAGEPWMVSF